MSFQVTVLQTLQSSFTFQQTKWSNNNHSVSSTSILTSPYSHQVSTLALFPARIMEISSPRLKAWLKRRRDWNVEMKGNHESRAIGANMSIPIAASQIRPNSRTVSHKPRIRISRFHVMARDSIAQPVAMKPRKHANMSGIDRSVNAMAKAMRAMTVSETTPCRKRSASRMLLDFLGLYQNS